MQKKNALSKHLCWLLLGVAAAPLEYAAAAPSNIGVAAAVQNKAEGIVSGKPEALAAGSNVFQDELVQTGNASMAQLLFLDQTSLSVGPSSQVKLDKFVYDPASNSGQLVLNATKGAFRFVSGSQDPHNYVLKTPVATIGVRGTIVDFLVGDELTIILVEGWIEVTHGGTVTPLKEPGKALIIHADGTTEIKTWDRTQSSTVNGISFPLFSNASQENPNSDVLPNKSNSTAPEVTPLTTTPPKHQKSPPPPPPPPPPGPPPPPAPPPPPPPPGPPPPPPPPPGPPLPPPPPSPPPPLPPPPPPRPPDNDAAPVHGEQPH